MGAGSLRYTNAAELSSGTAPPPELTLSAPAIVDAIIAESVPIATGTTDVEYGTPFEVPHDDDV